MTRRQAEALGLNFIDQVDFVDKEEKEKMFSRRAVLAIPEVREAIDDLSKATKNKINRNPMAKVLDAPIVSINSSKHAIYAHSLKLQLQHRRFIYLD